MFYSTPYNVGVVKECPNFLYLIRPNEYMGQAVNQWLHKPWFAARFRPLKIQLHYCPYEEYNDLESNSQGRDINHLYINVAMCMG